MLTEFRKRKRSVCIFYEVLESTEHPSVINVQFFYNHILKGIYKKSLLISLYLNVKIICE